MKDFPRWVSEMENSIEDASIIEKEKSESFSHPCLCNTCVDYYKGYNKYYDYDDLN